MPRKSKRRSRRNKNPSPPSKKETPVLTTHELFGDAQRYEPCFQQGPTLSGWKCIAVYQNRIPNFETKTMQRIGNVRKAWHGTYLDKLKAIAITGLLTPNSLRKRRKWRGVFPRNLLFGPGIYFAPNAHKALRHASVWTEFSCLLKCNVALGNPLHPNKAGDHRHRLIQGMYHSVVANVGSQVKGIWGNSQNMPDTEWVVYDEQQATVDMVFIYRKLPSDHYKTLEFPSRSPSSRMARSSPWNRPPRSTYGKVDCHPCSRDGNTCLNAYGTSGCIKTNRKSGCSKQVFRYCSHFEVRDKKR